MMRPLRMLVLVGILACPSMQSAHAVFSALARITPETEEKYNIYVQILPVEGQPGKYKIMPPPLSDAMSTYMRIYLIICKEQAPPRGLDFGKYIRSGGQGRTDVLSVAPLLPAGPGGPRSRDGIFPTKPADIILDKSLVTRTYLYIDYFDNVSDGGYYYCVDLATYPLPETRKMRISCSPAQGLGPEPGVIRQDSSDIIRVRGLYYLWYIKNKAGPASDAAIWYATSADGHTWAEKGEVLSHGPAGSWDAQGVSAPNILSAEDKYWLFYTGSSAPSQRRNPKTRKSAIGIAVADSPDGPWQKLPTNPVLQRDVGLERVTSVPLDDSCLIVRDHEYWLYYNGTHRSLLGPHTQASIAVAEKSEGAYEPYAVGPAVRNRHIMLAWPLGTGVAALTGHGPAGVCNVLAYAPDGRTFSKMQNLYVKLRSPGAYRPEAFTDSGKGRMIEWGIHTGQKDGFPPFLERFDCQWQESYGPAPE